MEHDALVELVHQADTPHPQEEVPARFGAFDSTCKGCDTTDNHPVKLVITDFGETDAEGNVVRESKTERWHHDCHALATKDEQSIAVVEQSNGAKGHELRLFLKGDPAHGIEPQFVPPEPVLPEPVPEPAATPTPEA